MSIYLHCRCSEYPYRQYSIHPNYPLYITLTPSILILYIQIAHCTLYCPIVNLQSTHLCLCIFLSSTVLFRISKDQYTYYSSQVLPLFLYLWTYYVTSLGYLKSESSVRKGTSIQYRKYCFKHITLWFLKRRSQVSLY